MPDNTNEQKAKVGFKVGHPKVGGRKPGSPIKRTWDARKRAEELGFHPIELLAHVAMKGSIPNVDGTETPVTTAQRLDAIKEAAPYLVPKLTATQLTGANDGPVQTQQLPIMKILSDPNLTKSLGELSMLMATTSGQDEVYADIV